MFARLKQWYYGSEENNEVKKEVKETEKNPTGESSHKRTLSALEAQPAQQPSPASKEQNQAFTPPQPAPIETLPPSPRTSQLSAFKYAPSSDDTLDYSADHYKDTRGADARQTEAAHPRRYGK